MAIRPNRPVSRVVIVVDRKGLLAGLEPVDWALGELRSTLQGRGVEVEERLEASSGGEDALSLLVVTPQTSPFGSIPNPLHGELPAEAESMALVSLESGGPVERIVVYGADPRGLVYAILELTDRIACFQGEPRELPLNHSTIEVPEVPVRSISRAFSSETEDREWLHDRRMWTSYLTMLATHRVNRFALTFGMHYNYPYGNEFLNDVYLHFPYPFLVNVPGHAVRAEGLPEAERSENLRLLKFIGQEAARRGIDFQLAIWTQRYDFGNCPDAGYPIVGVDESRHAEYCRDALQLILEECPHITGLTLRVHVESGIPEGSYDFWATYFEALVVTKPSFALDLHAKGVDDQLISLALETGKPVTISPKYTLEHQGLPYHQSSIRSVEYPPSTAVDAKWRFSEGTRKFLRYSYGDLLKEDRPYDVIYRIWPGTQRVLLWGDPALAGGYGRSSGFCGSAGVELCEPLYFKGRMGVGLEEGRQIYSEPELRPRFDWQKYAYQYRVWGRLVYRPDTDEDSWKRYLRFQFERGADAMERALSAASRVCLLLTTAHAPSGSNNSWWPEMYENMSIVTEAPELPYGYDMDTPARYGTVTANDPQLFCAIDEFAKAVLSGERVRGYTPLTVANWFEELANQAENGLRETHELCDAADPEFRRFSLDICIQAAIGRFFACKHRAACAWEAYRLSDMPELGEAAVYYYRKARDAWTIAAIASKKSYLPDIAFGPHSWLRGRWDDRLKMMDEDIALMKSSIEIPFRQPEVGNAAAERVLALISTWRHDQRIDCRHDRPEGYRPFQPVDLAVNIAEDDSAVSVVRLYYRHVNQAEHWRDIEMTCDSNGFTARIPAEYVNGEYPLQYYFEVEGTPGPGLYPGLNADLSNEPYFVLRRL